MTVPEFVNREVRRLTARLKQPTDQATWQTDAARMKATLDRQTLAGTQPPAHNHAGVSPTPSGTRYEFEVDPGIRLTAQRTPTTSDKRIGTIVLLSLEGRIKPENNALAEKVLANGWDVVGLELRATGKHAWPRDRVGRASDHNTAEWSLWLGRPLLGQWVKDVRTLVSVLATNGDNLGRITVVGYGPAAVVAACTAAIDSRVDQTVMIESLASYGGGTPIEQQRLGLLAPGIVRDVGDIPHIAALIAPRRLIVAGGLDSRGQAIPEAPLRQQYQFTAGVYGIENAADNLIVLPAGEINEVVGTLR